MAISTADVSAGDALVLPKITAPGGGRNRSAEFGMRSAPFFSAMMMLALAVMPGRSLRSALFTSTMVV